MPNIFSIFFLYNFQKIVILNEKWQKLMNLNKKNIEKKVF